MPASSRHDAPAGRADPAIKPGGGSGYAQISERTGPRLSTSLAKDLPTVQTAAAPAKEIKVQQRGQRVGGEKAYCEDCGTAKATMGDPRTNSSPEARDGVRRWCERCCTYLNQRPGAAPTDPFAAGWTYSRKIFKPYGAQFASKETDWPKNGWTYPNTAPVPRTDGRPSFVKEDTSVASSCRIDPDPLATADLIQNIRPAELRPIRPSGLAAEKDEYIPAGSDRPPSPDIADFLSTASIRKSGGKGDRFAIPDSYASAMSGSRTASGAPGSLLPDSTCPTECLVKGICTCASTPTGVLSLYAGQTALRAPRSPGDCIRTERPSFCPDCQSRQPSLDSLTWPKR